MRAMPDIMAQQAATQYTTQYNIVRMLRTTHNTVDPSLRCDMTLENLYTVVGQIQDVLDNMDTIMKQMAAVDKTYQNTTMRRDDEFLLEILRHELKIQTGAQQTIYDIIQDLRRRTNDLIGQLKSSGYR